MSFNFNRNGIASVTGFIRTFFRSTVQPDYDCITVRPTRIKMGQYIAHGEYLCVKNRHGMTLVEVLVAMAIVFIVFLGMSSAGLVVLDQNIKNSQRDEAVSVAEMEMQQVRNTPFATIAERQPRRVPGRFAGLNVGLRRHKDGGKSERHHTGDRSEQPAGHHQCDVEPDREPADEIVQPHGPHHREAKMNRRNAAFTLVELMIAMAIVMLVLYAAINFFIVSVRQYKVQTKITETNVEGILGLELFRQDLESLGFGLPWNNLDCLHREDIRNADLLALNDAPPMPRARCSASMMPRLPSTTPTISSSSRRASA